MALRQFCRCHVLSVLDAVGESRSLRKVDAAHGVAPEETGALNATESQENIELCLSAALRTNGTRHAGKNYGLDLKTVSFSL